jgi:hypothetical protein
MSRSLRIASFSKREASALLDAAAMKYYNPFEDVHITQHHLPHWQQAGATYFITYRLADAIPAMLLNRWRKEREIWMSFHPQPWTVEVEDEYHRRFSSRMERWLRTSAPAAETSQVAFPAMFHWM